MKSSNNHKSKSSTTEIVMHGEGDGEIGYIAATVLFVVQKILYNGAMQKYILQSSHGKTAVMFVLVFLMSTKDYLDSPTAL